MPEPEAPTLRPVTKAELKRVRKEIARRRKNGETEVWTDEELQKEGFARASSE